MILEGENWNEIKKEDDHQKFVDGMKEKNAFLSHDCRMVQGGKNLRQHLAYPQAETGEL